MSKDKQADANKKKFIKDTIDGLEKARESYVESNKVFDEHPVLEEAMPFLRIQIKTTIEVIDKYIEIFRKVKL